MTPPSKGRKKAMGLSRAAQILATNSPAWRRAFCWHQNPWPLGSGRCVRWYPLAIFDPSNPGGIRPEDRQSSNRNMQQARFYAWPANSAGKSFA